MEVSGIQLKGPWKFSVFSGKDLGKFRDLLERILTNFDIFILYYALC